MADSTDAIFKIVANIPETFTTKDLRNYFSFLIEKDAFLCFHFTKNRESDIFRELHYLRNQVSYRMLHKEEKDGGSKKEDRISQLLDSFVVNTRSSNRKKNNRMHARRERFKKGPSGEKKKIADWVKRREIKSKDGNSKKEKEVKNNDEKVENDDDDDSGENNDEKVEIKNEKVEMKNENVEMKNENVEIKNENVEKKNEIKLKFKEENDVKLVEETKDGGKKVEKATLIEKKTDVKRMYCIIKMKKELSEYMKFYHEKFWVDCEGTVLPARCLVIDLDPEAIAELYGSKGESQTGGTEEDEELKKKINSFNVAKSFAIKHINALKELKPRPDFVIPKGNVGTSSRWLKTKMGDWNIDPVTFAQMGIQYCRNRNLLRFASVPFVLILEECETLGQLRAFTDNGDVIPSIEDFRQIRENDKGDFDNIEYMDLKELKLAPGYSRERSAEDKFASEITLKWSKEGSGLVYYAEGHFRRCMEGGEEERSSEGWAIEDDPEKLGIVEIKDDEGGRKKETDASNEYERIPQGSNEMLNGRRNN